MDELKITILCNNSVKTFTKCIGEHGFSCFIEKGNCSYLFDTGQGLGISCNASILQKNLNDVDGILLSHGHWDHIGGLAEVLKITDKVPVYAHPDIFNRRFSSKDEAFYYTGIPFNKTYLEALGADFCLKRNEIKINQNMTLIGEITRQSDMEMVGNTYKYNRGNNTYEKDLLLDDNSLVINTQKGAVVILGCAHAGLYNILNYITDELGEKNIFAVIGGTHLAPASDYQFEKTVKKIKELDIKYIGASHCTGPEKASELKNIFGDRFFFADVGKEFTL